MINFDAHTIKCIRDYKKDLHNKKELQTRSALRFNYVSIFKILIFNYVDTLSEQLEQELCSRGFMRNNKELWNLLMSGLDVYCGINREEKKDDDQKQFAIHILLFYASHIYEGVCKYKNEKKKNCDAITDPNLIPTHTKVARKETLVDINLLADKYERLAEANDALSFIESMNRDFRKVFSQKGFQVFNNHYAYIRLGMYV